MMLGNILSIDEKSLEIELKVGLNEIKNIMDLYVLISDNHTHFIGEVTNIKNGRCTISLLGQIINNKFVYGFSNKPSFASKIDLIAPNFVNKIIGITDEFSNLYIGNSEIYPNVKVGANINSLFSQHFAVLGSTGSGKSCGFASMIQNLFNRDNYPKNASLFIIDSYGEYKNAFSRFNTDVNFKHITTNLNSEEEKVMIPTWLLDVDDFALLLNINKRSQIALIEKTLKFVDVFKKNDDSSIKYKNSVIAKSLLEIIVSGRPPAQIRDQIVSVLTKYNTSSLNLESSISQPGYVRTLKQCLLIDENGKIRAIDLIVDFLNQMIINNVPLTLPDKSYIYTLQDVLYALDFAFIDEGVLRNEDRYNDIYYIKSNLEIICNSVDGMFFNYPKYINMDDYLQELLNKDGKKAQLININVNYVDDRFAKVITKIYAKMLFNYCKQLDERATFPIHFILEEAHRYVQNDDDNIIIGYNIFDRITKEGRKFGILLGLISQRPKELSETSLSQCNNFFLYKMLHPKDLEFVSSIVPNMNESSIKKMQTLQPGKCMIFGSAFKLPIIIHMNMPSPSPSSSNCNIIDVWFKNNS